MRDEGMRKRSEEDENAWRWRDGNVGTQKRLRRHAVGAMSGRSFKGKSKRIVRR